AVVEAAGIRDILSKSLGSANAINVVQATLAALRELRDPVEESRRRGRPLLQKALQAAGDQRAAEAARVTRPVQQGGQGRGGPGRDRRGGGGFGRGPMGGGFGRGQGGGPGGRGGRGGGGRGPIGGRTGGPSGDSGRPPAPPARSGIAEPRPTPNAIRQAGGDPNATTSAQPPISQQQQ
ncbi:MAG: hypothetical protein HY329_19075, partial [Chloroflexi bacterium]|nr:hypothetical protein [Chloroflexota bacterium]